MAADIDKGEEPFRQRPAHLHPTDFPIHGATDIIDIAMHKQQDGQSKQQTGSECCDVLATESTTPATQRQQRRVTP